MWTQWRYVFDYKLLHIVPVAQMLEELFNISCQELNTRKEIIVFK